MQSSCVETVWGLSVGAGFDNGLKLAANYEQINTNSASATGDVERWTIGAGYDFNNFSVEANFGETNTDTAGDASGFGFAAQYDFGGGLQAQAGYGNSDLPGPNDPETWSLGLVMSF